MTRFACQEKSTGNREAPAIAEMPRPSSRHLWIGLDFFTGFH